MAADHGAAVQVIRAELVLRQAHGEAVDPDQFLARFPRYADLLRPQPDSVRTPRVRTAPVKTPGPTGAAPASTDSLASGVRPSPEEITLQKASPTGEEADTDSPEMESYATLRNPARPPTGPDRARPRAHPDGSTARSVPPEDRVIHGYRLLERLGGGTFGVVYKALSSGGVPVAVKEIRVSVGHAQAQRELEALELIKGLSHPYLLALHDYWIEDERLYMAIELADGTLAQWAERDGAGGVPRAELTSIFEEAAEALDFLHQHHVLHRDVKPVNILLLHGHAKVADMGLAKYKPESVAVTQTVAGTPAYMAPEAFRNEFRAESDQYALALCYAEMRTGRKICDGTNMAAVAAFHLFQQPKLDGLEPDEGKAVLRALSKDPTKRFPTCRDFVRALRPPPPSPPARRDRNAALIAGALLACLALLVVVLWRVLPSAPPPPPPPPPPPAPLVDWVPEDHGFITPEAAAIAPVGDRRYYDRIEYPLGGKNVEFLLIPAATKDDPSTFYMMTDKVTNGQFRVAADIDKFQTELSKLQQENPTLDWNQWHLGGVRNRNENVGDDNPELPVLRVNVLEAYAFARWLGGNLPTPDQWDRAAGKEPGKREIFANPDVPPQFHPDPPDIAVDRKVEGPLEVGKAKRDKSSFHCLDMAGDGREWTRNLFPGPGRVPSRPDKPQEAMVFMRGQSYYMPEPYHFDTDQNYVQFEIADPAVGFRVVVEP